MAYQYELEFLLETPDKVLVCTDVGRRFRRKYQQREKIYQHELLLLLDNNDDEDYVWTDEGIEQLRIFVLKKTLSSLHDGRACLKARTESLDWLLADTIHPFSFLVCCECMGLDPDKLREMVVDSLKR